MNYQYSTTDIYLAATLQCEGFPLEDITKDGNKYIFNFHREVDEKTGFPVLDIKVEEYWQGNILCEPKKLFSAFKEIKARMYDFQRGENGKSTG